MRHILRLRWEFTSIPWGRENASAAALPREPLGGGLLDLHIARGARRSALRSWV